MAWRSVQVPSAGSKGRGHLLALAMVLSASAYARADEGKPYSSNGKRELNIFPIAGGDSDVGFGGGQFSDWAKLGPTEGSFYWKVEDAAFVTFKVRNNSLILPFIDTYVLLTVPHFGPGGRLRLEVRPSFTDERTLGYYGIGNAAPVPAGVPDQDLEYRRMHPTLALKLRLRMFDHFFVAVGSSFTGSFLHVPSSSYLARDQREGSPEVRKLLGSFKSHAVELVEGSLEYDRRDRETLTRSGQYHSLRARVSPGGVSWMPYRYVQLEGTLRFYATVVPRWLYVSFRVVGDVFIGTPPFYELARFDDTPAIGGGKAVRGIPAQRYHGKVKLFENFEARSELLPFHVFHKAMVLGVAAFFDSGRTWTEPFTAHPELDGRGVGLKYGVGGGLRLQQGSTFVVRGDIAWSPDARPIGGYVDAAQIF